MMFQFGHKLSLVIPVWIDTLTLCEDDYCHLSSREAAIDFVDTPRIIHSSLGGDLEIIGVFIVRPDRLETSCLDRTIQRMDNKSVLRDMLKLGTM